MRSACIYIRDLGAHDADGRRDRCGWAPPRVARLRLRRAGDEAADARYARLYTLQGEPVAGLGVTGNAPLVANITLVYMSVNLPRACTATCERVVESDSFEFELVDAHGAASPNRAEVTISIIAGLDSTSHK